MLSKASIAILAAAAIFGAASAAQAGGSKNDADQQDLNQTMRHTHIYAHDRGYFRGRASSAYAYVPRSRLQRHWTFEQGMGRAPAGDHRSSKPPEGGSGK